MNRIATLTFALVATAGLTLAGCNKREDVPPTGAGTSTMPSDSSTLPGGTSTTPGGGTTTPGDSSTAPGTTGTMGGSTMDNTTSPAMPPASAASQ